MPRDLEHESSIGGNNLLERQAPAYIQASLHKQRIYALLTTGVILIVGSVGNHYLKTKYDVDYIISNSSSRSGIYVPDLGSDDVFLLGVFGIMEYLKQ